MKIISCIIMRQVSGKSPVLLSAAYELSIFGFFQRSGVKEIALFVSREVIQRSKRGEMQSVKHKEYIAHCQILANGLGCCVLSDEEYPQRVAFLLIREAFDMFLKQYDTEEMSAKTGWKTTEKDLSLNVTGLDSLLVKYQNPSEADKITKIKKEIEETKAIVIKTIEELMERGEKLEDLAQKSNDLSLQSKAFMKESEKLNRCCIIL
jgi:synaptobrevin family protein YKT6